MACAKELELATIGQATALNLRGHTTTADHPNRPPERVTQDRINGHAVSCDRSGAEEQAVHPPTIGLWHADSGNIEFDIDCDLDFPVECQREVIPMGNALAWQPRPVLADRDMR